MHLYHAQMEDRRRVFWLLATAATTLSLIIGGLIDTLFSAPPAFLGPPSATLLFGLLYALYDRWLWAQGIGPLRVSRIPRLAGSWTGHITIKDDQGGVTKHLCLVQIQQTWLRMSIEFRTPISRSISSAATLREPGELIEPFRYEYHVEPEGDASPIEAKHDGVARLKLVDGNWGSMKGNYFNDQDFHRFGDYSMKRSDTPIKTEDWLQNPHA